MKYLTLMLILVVAQVGLAQGDPAPAKPDSETQTQSAQTEVKPLEEVLKTEKSPNGKHIMVKLHMEVLNANDRNAMHVKFIDVRPSPAVNVEHWDPKLREIKPGTILTIVGELHFGAVSGATKSLRYKVKEVGGQRYNDHRHWRTDRAIYIVNPTYEIRALTREEIMTQPQRDILAAANQAAADADTPEKKKQIMAEAEKKIEEMMVGGQKTLLTRFSAAGAGDEKAKGKTD